MMENPYSEMARAFSAEDSGEAIRIGDVVGVEPLAVSVGGLTVSGGALFCNAGLLPELQKAEIRLPGSQIDEPGGSVTFSEPLKAGDRVLLYSDNDQTFYLICRVVNT